MKRHLSLTRHRAPSPAALGLALFPALAACTGVFPGSGSDAGGGAAPGGGAEACDIQAVMAKPENGCTNAGCHGTQFQGGLDLLSSGVEQRLVGARSTTTACKGRLLVDPNDPENSLLLSLIDAERFHGSDDACGVMMPLGTATGVSADDLACFTSWVARMASEAPPGTVAEPPPFEPAPPESYLGKVKTLVNGGQVTDEELAEVRANPAALRSLVARWTEAPGFQAKMLDFLVTNLQQSIVRGSQNPQLGKLRGPRGREVIASLEQAFARTAWDLIDAGRPFNEIATTRRWVMNTASLVALAYLENTAEALRTDRHTIFKNPGPGRPTLPVSPEVSAEDRVWHIPTLPDDCEGTINGFALLEMFTGFVNCPSPYRVPVAETVLSDSDFSDWRTVTLETGDPPKFYDLPALRGARSIRLRLPRVGFFTTPAFFTGAETNADNQFRVTTNQTMIVALGAIFSPADPTAPVRLDGLASEHAEPGSACFGCHQHLDPMRSYFANAFATTYHAGAAASSVTPSFAFEGETHDGGDLYALAETLAAHPEFPKAWVQKLCYYANSQACDERDPEFLRLVDAFVESGFDFKQLLVELFSSPLVTGAALADTYRTEEFMVSIARQQHLCQLLDTRLGLEGVCQRAGAFAALIPNDAYSRGSAEPVQPAVTGPFHFAAAEKLCVQLSNVLVQNNAASRFSPSDTPAAVRGLVEDLMGLPPTHPRHDLARDRLTAHIEDARAAGANAVVALRSAFTLACVSPDVTALGL